MVLTYNGEKITFYVDKVEVGSATANGESRHNTCICPIHHFTGKKLLNIHKGYGIHIVCSIHTVLIIKRNGSIIMEYTSLFVKYFYHRNVRLAAERMHIIIILHVILIDIWRFSVEIAIIYIPPCFYMCVYSGDIFGCCTFQVPPRGYTVH